MSETLQMEATATDFDFLLGSWNVANRMLRRRLAGSDDWEEFAATAVVRPILDGLGNEDVFRTEHDGGFVGMSFRFFDPEKRRWSIYWADSRRPGELDPPVVGCFTWSRGTTESPRWEQAFSDDGGRTWETNWVMDFAPAEGGSA